MKDAATNELLQALMKCVAACDHCASACLDEREVQHLAACIRLDMACADLCAATARAVTRNADHALELIRLCGHTCRACAEECAQHGHPHCRKCAEVCNACAEQCEAYVHTRSITVP